MTANDVWIAAIIQRPAIRERTSRSARFSDSRSKRCGELGAAAHRLAEQDAGDADSDSCTSDEMSAIAPCLTVVILRRWLPTRRASSTKNGSSASENSASRQSSRNIATTLAITVVTLPTIEAAVLVTTFCTPPMSLAIRDWISPVRVRVKNASESRCRCR